MPRHPRVHAAHLLYHIIARGNNGQAIYQDEEDYQSFISIVKNTKSKYPFKLYAYALMPNHFHLLLEVVGRPNSRIMQSILTAYVRHFNVTHKRRGHLFQGRYKAIICQKDAYLMELMRYIHLNPVRAKLVEKPEHWDWSGHKEYTGKSERGLIERGVASELFGTGKEGYRKYRQFLLDGMGMMKRYEEEFHPSDSKPFIGNDDFKAALMENEREMTGRKHKSIEEIIHEEADRAEVKEEVIKGKSQARAAARARQEVIKRAAVDFGHRQAAIARQLHCSPSYVTRVLHRNCQRCQD